MNVQTVTPFALLDQALPSLIRGFPTWPPRQKAVLIVVSVLLMTLLVFGASLLANIPALTYVLFVLLGILYGVLLSYPAMKFLGAKIQAALAGFLGGISLGNLGATEAAVRSGVRTVAKTVVDTVTLAREVVAAPGTPPGTVPWIYLDTALVYCIWMTILTVFLIVAANAYFEE